MLRSRLAALASAALLLLPGASRAAGNSPAPARPPATTAGSQPAASPGASQASPPAANATAPAPAKDAPPAEAPAPIPEKVDPKLFDEALSDYFEGSDTDGENPEAKRNVGKAVGGIIEGAAGYVAKGVVDESGSNRKYRSRAASKLYAWLAAAPKTDDNYAWGQYFLARSLIDLGLTHAGAVYLARIARERTNPAVLPRALEVLRGLTDGPHDEVMIDEQVFAALDLGFLDQEAGDYAHYQQGLVDLRVGNERWANTHFAKLQEGSPEASYARFALLVTRLKTVKEPSEELISDFLTLSKDEKLTRAARNEAALAVARLRYERKDFKGTLDAYGLVQLPELDPGRATLYLEEAWTRYKMGELRAALGILTTLDAPSFRDEFLPDKYLLRALIFRDLCHYLPAKRAAKELTRRFADSLDAIAERDDLTQDLRLRRAAEAHGATRRAARFRDMLELESERLGRYAGSFGDRLQSQLTKLYALSLGEAERIYQARLNEAVRQEADTLLRAAEQVRLMEYEVGLKLYERVKKGSKVALPPEEVLLKPEQIAFKFDGEYWNDELKSYRVRIESRCIEETP